MKSKELTSKLQGICDPANERFDSGRGWSTVRHWEGSEHPLCPLLPSFIISTCEMIHFDTLSKLVRAIPGAVKKKTEISKTFTGLEIRIYYKPKK